jgi:tetratricopeptide (TPR) repeat protein
VKKFLFYFILISQFIRSQSSVKTFSNISDINTLQRDTVWVRNIIKYAEFHGILRHSFWDSITPIAQKYKSYFYLTHIYYAKSFISGNLDMDLKKFNDEIKQSVRYAQINGDSSFLASLYYDYGSLTENMQLTDDAFRYYNLSLKLYTKLKNKSFIASCNNRMALLYLNQGNITEAIKHNNNSLKITINRLNN